MRSVRTLSASFLSLAIFFFALPSPGAGQVGMIPDDECRCVDPDGNEIENCRCFRTLDRGQFAWSVTGSRPRIGITLSTSGDENAAVGATIQSVMEDGPAERAGLKEGDIITYFDGRSLFDPLEDAEAEADLDLDGSLPAQRLLQMAQDLEPGDEVEVRYLRDGESATTTLTAEDLEGWGGNYLFLGEGWEGQWEPRDFGGAWNLQEFEGNWREALEDFQSQWNTEEFREQWKEAAEQFQSQNWRNLWFDTLGAEGNVVFWRGEDEPNVLFETTEPWNLYFGGVEGLQLEKLNPNLGEYFGTDMGVLVTEVEEDSTLGLQAGDVVLRVGDREVGDPSRLRKILLSYDPDEEITLHIMRQKREMTVTGTRGG